jgi:hypothetical protein
MSAGKAIMARRSGQCPACGGPVEFHSRLSLVAVCEFCHSVVARTDRALADHGKVAEITDSESPLALGLRGVWQGKGFRLIGRVQYRHGAGGKWDEWYLALPESKWGWLSEAQGRFAITQYRKLSDTSQLPPRESFHAGEKLELQAIGAMTVSEVGEATVIGAEGELPFNPVQDAVHRFVDLEGPDGRFATIEYGSEGPAVFTGQAATLIDLGLADAALKAQPEQGVGALQLNCPQCGGVLTLVAPDEAQRVTCPNCRSLLDVEGEKLEYLSTLKEPKPPLRIALGTKGKLRDVEYTVIGYLRRSVTYDKVYYWQEYLLYAPQEGYRWLIDSDQHWSLGSPVSLGDVTISGAKAQFKDREFRLFQSTNAEVRQVWGEFYWKVKVGDENPLRDYVAPPFSLSLETTATADGRSEMNATVSGYLPHAEVEQAFGLKDLPRGWGVAPNQPNPVTWEIFVHWVASIVVIAAAGPLIGWISGRSVDLALTIWAAVLMTVIPLGAGVYAHFFEVSRWKDSEFNPYGTGFSEDDE